MKIQLLEKWKFARIDAAGIAIALSIGLLFYWSAVRPVLAAQENHAAQEAQLANQRENAALAAARAEDLKSKVSTARTALSKCAVQLAPAVNVNSRIGQLTELATQQGLKVDEIQPAEATYCRNYGSVPIRLNGSGEYRTWAAFLHQMPKNFPDISVDSFQLTGKPDTPGSQVEFRVNLVWFVAPRPTMAGK